MKLYTCVEDLSNRGMALPTMEEMVKKYPFCKQIANGFVEMGVLYGSQLKLDHVLFVMLALMNDFDYCYGGKIAIPKEQHDKWLKIRSEPSLIKDSYLQAYIMVSDSMVREVFNLSKIDQDVLGGCLCCLYNFLIYLVDIVNNPDVN